MLRHVMSNDNRKLREMLNGQRAPTLNNLEFLVKKLRRLPNNGNSNSIQNLINKIPMKTNWNTVNFTAPALFHGSQSLLKKGYPSKAGGSWFAKSPHQAILHAIARTGNTPAYLYVYHLKKTPKLINISSSSKFNNLGMHLVRELPWNGWAFANSNYTISKKLCEMTPKLADGWYFPRDQTQVMLCKPAEFLELYAAYKLENYTKTIEPKFTTNWATNWAYWRRPKGLKYGKLSPIPIKRKPNNAPKN